MWKNFDNERPKEFQRVLLSSAGEVLEFTYNYGRFYRPGEYPGGPGSPGLESKGQVWMSLPRTPKYPVLSLVTPQDIEGHLEGPVTLEALFHFFEGEVQIWEAYFDGRFDDDLRREFEVIVGPQVRSSAVMLRGFLNHMEKR